ncbi:hypothetical protein BRD00_10570 [Halobacteriales archaeon QS_8_69_26]|nr:MAG: hypothetical protein BRD00_10570 [Halobacteriales archaeon QS_8_69_26]
MGKVSIGLRGWRFDEEEVFTDEGEYRPFDEMDLDVLQRLVRLSVVYGGPCDACWLIHGDENIDECNRAGYVYGEPLAEVLVCEEHEPDFVYWFREAGGDEGAGEKDFDDHFHEWFLDGGRAPEGYEGMEYVADDPEDLPEPPQPDTDELDVDARMEDGKRIDMRNMEIEDLDYPS